jgi:class 3 adenylate cyclase
LSTEGVTILYTDMVGSMALASTLTPYADDELSRGHFSILRQAIVEASGAGSDARLETRGKTGAERHTAIKQLSAT